jgi:general stress protein 26
MPANEPTTELDSRFSSDSATATPWSEASTLLEKAEIYWLSTVRPDGHPHVTPLIAVWQDGALHFCTGPAERKARNLAQNANCILTTGRNSIDEGLDVIVEGAAVAVNDEVRLQQLADTYAAKYDWHFSVRNGAFYNDEGGRALVFEVRPTTAFAFGKGEPFSQTRYRFEG